MSAWLHGKRHQSIRATTCQPTDPIDTARVSLRMSNHPPKEGPGENPCAFLPGQEITQSEPVTCAASQDAKPPMCSLPSQDSSSTQDREAQANPPFCARSALLADGINCCRGFPMPQGRCRPVNHYKVSEDFTKMSCKVRAASPPLLPTSKGVLPSCPLHYVQQRLQQQVPFPHTLGKQITSQGQPK